METIAWNQVFSNYKTMNFNPNGRVQKIRISQNLPGRGIRAELSNLFDPVPLEVKSLRVGLSPNSGEMLNLTLHGEESFTLAAGKKSWTDYLPLDIPAKADLYFELEVESERKQLSTMAHVSSKEMVATNMESEWTLIYGLTSVAVDTPLATTAVGFFGDSLTNQGYYSNRTLQNLYAACDRTTGFNAGISGNRLLKEFNPAYGERGVNRFIRDALGYYPNVLVTLIGTNDLFHPGRGRPMSELPTAEELIRGYKSLYKEAALNDTTMVLLTIPPFRKATNEVNESWTPEKEEIRLGVNQWIMEQANSVDLAGFVADPRDSTLLDEKFDAGDHLHFSEAGGRLIGDFLAAQLDCQIPKEVPAYVL